MCSSSFYTPIKSNPQNLKVLGCLCIYVLRPNKGNEFSFPSEFDITRKVMSFPLGTVEPRIQWLFSLKKLTETNIILVVQQLFQSSMRARCHRVNHTTNKRISQLVEFLEIYRA